jgi:hypothetical protein
VTCSPYGSYGRECGRVVASANLLYDSCTADLSAGQKKETVWEDEAMQIKTNGRYKWRLDLYDHVSEELGADTRTDAIDASCEFTRNMLANLERAVDHSDMTEELAEILSTPKVKVQYQGESGVNIHDRDRE